MKMLKKGGRPRGLPIGQPNEQGACLNETDKFVMQMADEDLTNVAYWFYCTQIDDFCSHTSPDDIDN